MARRISTQDRRRTSSETETIGYWILDIGYWILDIGFIQLIIMMKRI